MPSQGERYRKTYIELRYDAMQRDYARAMKESERMRASKAAEAKYLEGLIARQQQHLNDLKKAQMPGRQSVSRTSQSLVGADEKFIFGAELRVGGAKRATVSAYESKYEMSQGLARTVGDATASVLDSIAMLPADSPADMAGVVEQTLLMDEFKGMAGANEAQRMDAANALVESLEAAHGPSTSTRTSVARAMNVSPLDVDPEIHADRKRQEIADQVREQVGPAMGTLARIRGGMGTGAQEAQANARSEQVARETAMANQAISAASGQLNSLMERRTALNDALKAPTEEALWRRATELGLGPLRTRERRYNPKRNKDKYFQQMARKAVKYLKHNDPSTDISEAGRMANQIRGLIDQGTLTRAGLLEKVADLVGKKKKKRDAIVMRVLAFDVASRQNQVDDEGERRRRKVSPGGGHGALRAHKKKVEEKIAKKKEEVKSAGATAAKEVREMTPIAAGATLPLPTLSPQPLLDDSGASTPSMVAEPGPRPRLAALSARRSAAEAAMASAEHLSPEHIAAWRELRRIEDDEQLLETTQAQWDVDIRAYSAQQREDYERPTFLGGLAEQGGRMLGFARSDLLDVETAGAEAGARMLELGRGAGVVRRSDDEVFLDAISSTPYEKVMD